jgi:hypothetical protein
MARTPQTMSRIRTRDHSPVINHPTDLDRKELWAKVGDGMKG